VAPGGRPLRHLTGSETPAELADDAPLGVTCYRADRAWARRTVAQAANLRLAAPVYKAKTIQSPVEGVSVVYLDFRDDADEQALKTVKAEVDELLRAALLNELCVPARSSGLRRPVTMA
jgi:hypothetical protein